MCGWMGNGIFARSPIRANKVWKLLAVSGPPRSDENTCGDAALPAVAGVEDFTVALATYRAACERWPKAAITLRQGAKVIEDSRRTRLAST